MDTHRFWGWLMVLQKPEERADGSQTDV